MRLSNAIWWMVTVDGPTTLRLLLTECTRSANVEYSATICAVDPVGSLRPSTHTSPMSLRMLSIVVSCVVWSVVGVAPPVLVSNDTNLRAGGRTGSAFAYSAW
jgi:hypothetical protein